MKQLAWSDYRLIPDPKKYSKFKIQSSEDHAKLYRFYIDELLKCYKVQFGELCNDDFHIMADISWQLCHVDSIKYLTTSVKIVSDKSERP